MIIIWAAIQGRQALPGPASHTQALKAPEAASHPFLIYVAQSH